MYEQSTIRSARKFVIVFVMSLATSLSTTLLTFSTAHSQTSEKKKKVKIESTVLKMGQCAKEDMICYNRPNSLLLSEKIMLCRVNKQAYEECLTSLQKPKKAQGFFDRWPTVLAIGLMVGFGTATALHASF